MALLPSIDVLKKMQAASGLVFATFLFLHLINSISSHKGQVFYDTVQSKFRLYYQNPFVEIVIVLGSLLIHFLSNILLFYLRNENKPEKIPDSKLSSGSASKYQRYSGLVLAVIVGLHATFTRILPYLHGQIADFQTVSFTVEIFPIIFYPYYIFYGINAIYHLSHGFLQSTQVLGLRTGNWVKETQSISFKIFVAIASLAIISAVMAFGGIYYSDINRSKYPEFRKEWGLDNIVVKHEL